MLKRQQAELRALVRVPRPRKDEAQLVSNTAWALATLQMQPEPLVNALLVASAKALPQFLPLHFANTAWAFATLAIDDQSLWGALADAAVLPLSLQSHPRDLAITAWAFAACRVEHQPFFQAVSAAAVPRMSYFCGRDLSQLAWAYAALDVADFPLFQSIATVSNDILCNEDDLTAQDLTNLLWSSARVSFEDRPMLEVLARRASEEIEHFTPQHLANSAWSLAVLQVVYTPAFMDSVVSTATRKMMHFDA